MNNPLDIASYFIMRAYEDGKNAQLTNMEEKLDEIERNHPAYEPIMAELLNRALNAKSSVSIKKGEVRDWVNSLLS